MSRMVIKKQEESVLESEVTRVKPPPLFKVMLLNDDFTPMDFVVLVLEMVFELDETRSMQIMLEAHNKGRALVRTLPFEDARQRVYTAKSLAQQFGYPLSFYLEPEG